MKGGPFDTHLTNLYGFSKVIIGLKLDTQSYSKKILKLFQKHFNFMIQNIKDIGFFIFQQL